MGGRYCAINSELIAQYRPPMSFHYKDQGWTQIGKFLTHGDTRILLGLKPSQNSRAASQWDSSIRNQPLGFFRYKLSALGRFLMGTVEAGWWIQDNWLMEKTFRHKHATASGAAWIWTWQHSGPGILVDPWQPRYATAIIYTHIARTLHQAVHEHFLKTPGSPIKRKQ